jgi:hypothetical protein
MKYFDKKYLVTILGHLIRKFLRVNFFLQGGIYNLGSLFYT